MYGLFEKTSDFIQLKAFDYFCTVQNKNDKDFTRFNKQ